MRRSRRSVRQLGQSIDIVNIVLAVIIIILAVIVIVTGGQHKFFFPIIFGVEALINLLSGIKQVASDEMGKAIFLFIGFVVMTAITVATTVIIL